MDFVILLKKWNSMDYPTCDVKTTRILIELHSARAVIRHFENLGYSLEQIKAVFLKIKYGSQD